MNDQKTTYDVQVIVIMSTFETIDDRGFHKRYNLPYIWLADVLCLFTMTYL